MKQTDIRTGAMPANRKIVTYTIGVLESSCKSDYPALLTSMATQGGGKFFPTGNSAEIQQALLRILNEVQAVNSVFASSSLPVSVNAQGTYLNQVFMGMFRPDALGTPRWVGNLKQYQIGYNASTQTTFLADATGVNALSSAGTGFLSTEAASFWTCTNATRASTLTGPVGATTPYNGLPTCANDPTLGFWANSLSGTALQWDLHDGEVVEKGGAAQVLRRANFSNTYTAAPGTSTNPRKLYTYCPSGSSCNSTLSDTSNLFDTSNASITDAQLGTGPRTISSITSAATVLATSFTPSTGAAPATILITSFSKGASATVTATVASTASLVSGTTQISVTTTATKYDCAACVVTVVDATHFTYNGTNGNQAAPGSTTATILKNFVTVSKAGHGMPVGQTMTLSTCATHLTLNTTDATVSSVTDANTFVISIAVTLGSTAADTACSYSPKTATVTTATAHGFPNGGAVTIAGAAPAGYNGTWVVTSTGTTTFTYQHTVAAKLANFGAAGATATSSSVTRDTLARWVRGEDNVGDEASLCPPGSTAGVGNCPSTAINIRPSLHGDVLHSRPAVINYGGATISITGTSDSGSVRTATASSADVVKIGTTGTTVIFANGNTCPVTLVTSTTFTYPTTGCGIAGAQTAATGKANVVVFYGDNGGTFHAVNGNQVNPLTGMADPGSELWGFIPTEFYGKLKRLHENSPVLKFPATSASIIPAPETKDYFFDGPTGVYQAVDGLGRTTKAYLYLTMRRGGRMIYALDVSDPTNPKFLWKHTNADSGFSELGQTWSQPTLARVAGYADPVLIFGAGYDGAINPGYAGAEDVEPPTADTMGRGIFILDAATGALVWSATPNVSGACSSTSCQKQVAAMTYSIPSDVSFIDRDGDGYIDRLYVGDVGGNVWRVDLEPTGGITPNFWQVEKLAALGCATGTCTLGTTPRKILYPPEVISTATYDAVFVTTGDREHPLYSTTAQSACTVSNRAYLLKDTVITKDGSSLTTLTETDLFNATTTNWAGSLSGYYINFQACEKGVNAPLVTAGKVYFGTSKQEAPSASRCEETLGEATGYSLSPFTGAYTHEEFDGGGLPPSPVSGIVNIVDATGKTIQVPFCIGCGGEDDGSFLLPTKIKVNPSNKRSRNYWYIEGK
jgi:type IV pilus assembly protein PilY1